MDKATVFLEQIADIFELESKDITMETVFRKAIPKWDSLKGFSIIVMVEEEYGKKIQVSDFLNMKTIGDIYNAILEKR